MIISSMTKINILNRKIIIAFTFMFLSSSAAYSLDYYWVAGSGQYNDYANHWATTSGGSVFHTVEPSVNDNVYFDSNSFTAPGQVVSETILTDILANNFICSGTLFPPVFDFTGITTQFYGSFMLDSGVTWTSSYIQFYGTASSNITLTTHGIELPGIIFIFPLGAGTISLADDLNCGDLDIEGGIFYSNNHNITMTAFEYIGITTPAEIHFGTSVITCNGGIFDATYCGSNLHVDSCTLILNQDLNEPLYCSNQHFNHVILSNGTSILGQIYGTNAIINLLEIDGALTEADLYLDTCHINRMIFSSAGAMLNLVQVDIDTLIFNNGTMPNFDTSDTLTVNDLLIINPGSGLIGNVPFVIKKTGGVVCTDNITLQNIEAIGGAQFFAGPNSIDAGGNTGWQFTACTPATSNVWPGDANYDLTANNLDLINIGINYGSTGAVRPSATNNWIAQPCPDWLGYFNNGANFKNADCNGDGTVDADDTTAVALNYGQTHPARLSEPNSVTSGGPELYFDLTGVSVVPGNTVTIPINLGTSLNSVDALYGIAFTINYNPSYVDAQGISVNYPASWLSSGLMLSMAKDFPLAGKTDLVVVRTDQTDAFGFGAFAEITFTVPLSVAGNFYLSFSGVEANVSSGNELILAPGNVGNPTQVFYPEADNSNISFYPNPVHGTLHISAEKSSYDRVIIKDIGARIISASSFTTEADISSFEKGIYFVELWKHNVLVARAKISRL